MYFNTLPWWLTLLVAVAFVHKIGIEEAFLTQEFGAAYARYRLEVPALIPFVRPR